MAELDKDDKTLETAIIKANSEIEKARIDADARIQEAGNQKETKMPDVHIHQGGKKKIQVNRTATGLEGTAEDIE